jgi:biopolymer transport protein TolR
MGLDVGKSTGKLGRAQPSMNVTPLVDVVLVLLIIFMVVTPLLAKQFWIHLPNEVDKEQPSSRADDEAVVVFVTKGGDITVNRATVHEEQFPDELRRALAAKGQHTVFFDADEQAPFGAAVKAMDVARGGGADTIAVLTQPLAR